MKKDVCVGTLCLGRKGEGPLTPMGKRQGTAEGALGGSCRF